mgnify:CR=1 FL=1
MEIQVDGKKVLARLRSALDRQSRLLNDFQALAVDTSYHGAEHGDCTLLNRFYAALSRAHQSAFLRWIAAEVSSLYPKDTKPELFWLGHRKEFFVRKNTGEDRRKFVDHLKRCVEAANAENASDIDKAFGRFFEIDPAKAANLFDDVKLYKQLHTLLKKAKGDDAEVSADTIAALEQAVSTFDSKVPAHVVAAVAAK